DPMAYISFRQVGELPQLSFLLRAQGDPLILVRAVQREWASLDSGLSIDGPLTLDAVIDKKLAARRIAMMLIAAFGALALLLASIGVYAMFVNLVAAREGEFIVRMALGSSPHNIAGLVLRQGAGWMAAGLAGGGLGICLVSRLLRG